MLALANHFKCSVFVTTYAVGNLQGFACGKWFDLSQYIDKQHFIDSALEYCRDVLGDNDPELCFSDVDCNFATQGVIGQLLDSDDISPDVYSAFVNANGFLSDVADTVSTCQNRYVGEYDSVFVFAKNYVAEHYQEQLDNMPGLLAGNLNYDDIGTELMATHSRYGNHFFNNYY